MTGSAAAVPEASDYGLGSRFARAVLDLFANRTDAHGAYTSSGEAYTAKTTLSVDVLRKHYQGERTVGVYLISKENSCRFCAFDIDAHDGEDPDENLETALELVERLAALGYEPILLDSDGRGGFHVLVVFESPASSRDVFVFAKAVAPEGIEFFPKQPELNKSTPFGSWLRLPGKHPRREHWTLAWDGRAWRTWEETAEFLTDPPLSPAPPTAATEQVDTPQGEGAHPLDILHGRSETAEIAERAEIPPRFRNRALMSLAGTMRRRGMLEDEIAAALQVVNRNRCRPSLEPAEVAGIAASAARYEPGDPLQFAAAVPESREAGLALVTERLLSGVRAVSIRRFVRRGGAGGLLDVELSDDTVIPLGTVSNIVSFNSFKKAFAEGTRIVLHKDLAKSWDEVLQWILHLVEEEDGESVMDHIEEFIAATYISDPPLDADDEDDLEGFFASRRKPFLRRAERVFVRLDSLMLINRTRGALTLGREEWGSWLARLGWKRTRPGFGRRGHQLRAWLYEAPEGWAP